MNTRGRRWVLPFYLVLLALLVLAAVASFAVFGGPSSAVAWLSMVVTFLALVVLIAGELMARRGSR